MLNERKTKWFSGQVEEKRSFIINGIAQENEVRKPLVDFLGCVRLCKPGKNGRIRPLPKTVALNIKNQPKNVEEKGPISCLISHKKLVKVSIF